MKNFWDKKIPTLLGMALIAVGVVVTTYFANTVGVRLFSGAAPSENPVSIRITNVTDTSFTVAYQTDALVSGTLSVTSPINQTVLDDRDQSSGSPKEYHLHSLTAKNLKPDTAYLFSIVSGATTFQNNGQSFQVKTGPKISSSPTDVVPATGSIVESDGNAPAEALVFITANGAQSLSAIAKSNGNYIIPLNDIRTSDLSDVFDTASVSAMQILATDSQNSSKIVILPNTNPIPQVTLGNDYDFTQSTTPLATSSAESGFPSFGLDTSVAAQPVITTPKKDQGFTDTQPQFSGKAQPNSKVDVVIHSDTPVETQVTTDAHGNWNYRPTAALSPGQHTITITASDSNGILRTIQQSFVVYASGTQNDLTGTPTPSITSGSTTPTQAVTLTPIPTQAVVTPTVIPTLVPTAAIITSAPITPKPTLPPTGSDATVFGALIGGIITTVGVTIFLASQGVGL